jgi:hypothetical protein
VQHAEHRELAGSVKSHVPSGQTVITSAPLENASSPVASRHPSERAESRRAMAAWVMRNTPAREVEANRPERGLDEILERIEG